MTENVRPDVAPGGGDPVDEAPRPDATTDRSADRSTDDSRLRTLPALGTALRTGWRHLVVGLVLGVVAGGLVAATSPSVYQATTTVRVGGGLVPVGDFRPDTLWAEDQVALAGTAPVRDAMAARIGGGIDADDVADSLAVTAETNSNYLVFTWTDDDPAAAERGADLAALVYIWQAKEEAEQRWQGHDTLLVSLIKQLDDDDPRAEDLRAERVQLEETVVDPGKIAGRAEGTARQTSLGTPSHLLAGGLGGLVLGAVSAYLWFVRRRDVAVEPVDRVAPVGGPAPDRAPLLPPLPGKRPTPATPATPVTASASPTAGPEEPAARTEGGILARFRERGSGSAAATPTGPVEHADPRMPVLGELRLDATDAALAPLGRSVVRWILQREDAGGPGNGGTGPEAGVLRLGVYATPDAPERSTELVRRALRAVGADGRLEIEEVDASLAGWRREFEACRGVLLVTGDGAWSDESVAVARMHLELVEVEVLGLVRVGGGSRA
ncbi:hypothetical protein RDV89_15000 [Nocardioides zeae]|uniref:Polysaccharide chain length determinant N-terminal domain-containing protein n=1 Tax=Nocardioides imazamoxiresistens TaxID=3231893 RepID=A0ABU3Q059_9ACTN|nr:hypothetical protein [Nocardioides zeae]MDT9594390.1 hypothetical protein [Nocardioides zeae]